MFSTQGCRLGFIGSIPTEKKIMKQNRITKKMTAKLVLTGYLLRQCVLFTVIPEQVKIQHSYTIQVPCPTQCSMCALY